MVSIFLVLLGVFTNMQYSIQQMASTEAFDQQLYEDVLDPELCIEQLTHIINDTLLLASFVDTGMRAPRGILKGNFVDMGNYPQCLEINEDIGNSIVEGKYCTITVPLQQDNLQFPSLPEWPELPDFPWPELLPNSTIHNHLIRTRNDIEMWKLSVKRIGELRVSPENSFSGLSMNLAICIPKTCNTQQALGFYLFNATAIGLQYYDNYCRLPNDKLWVPADYIAIVLISVLGVLTMLSTTYDVYQNILLQRGPKSENALYQSFSVYTNCRRLTTFSTSATTLDCLDGVRVIAMMWVIVGHTFTTHTGIHLLNPLDIVTWMESFYSIWVTAAPITVDTFFMLSGLLLVYSSVGKFGRMSFIKNIHLFYLNRLLRMFPLLALGVLLQASLYHHVADGPNWSDVVRKTQVCRSYWWAALLHVQNYVGDSYCLDQSWYLAVDVQLHIISPIVLFWVLGSRKAAWMALVSGLLASLVAASSYIFTNNFVNKSSSEEESSRYMNYYYINTLTRASPFFVGMIFGYLLVLYKGTKICLKPYQVFGIWLLAIGTTLGVVLVTYPTNQADWDNQLIDNLLNSFMRPAWACAVALMVFACAKGYGGPVNWFLSLRMWKLPARISYAMYIVHMSIMVAMNGTYIQPYYFSASLLVYRFMADIAITSVVAFFATLLVDAPFSTLIKLAIGSGTKKREPKKLDKVSNSGDAVLNEKFDSRYEDKTRL